MRKSVNQITALLLSILLLFGAFGTVGNAAVNMPAGVSEGEIIAAIPKVGAVVKSLTALSDNGDVKSTVYAQLFSDQTMNEIFRSIYTEFSAQTSTLQTLGIDLSVQGVKGNLYNYPEVQAALGENTAWEQVFSGAFNPRWNLRQKSDFTFALGSMLAPLNELLYTLLCSGTYSLNALVSIKGDNGYDNAIVPILKALGVSSVMTQSEFAARAGENRYNMIGDVVNMAFSALDAILDDPVAELTKRLPGIAYFLDNDGLSAALTTLLEPMQIRIAIFSLGGVDKLLENLDLFSSSADFTDLLQNLDLGAALGSDAKLTLPEIDLKELASCGSMQGDTFVPNEAQSFVYIFRWLLDAVKLNQSQLPALLGADLSGAGDFINRFLSKDNDTILKMLLDLLNLSPAETVLNYQWSYPEYTPSSVAYTPNLGAENYEKMLTEIDDTLNEFLDEFTDSGTLSDILAQRIYSNTVVTTLVKSLYGALYSEETAGALGLLGIDASPAGVADAISSRYPAVARALRGYTSWDRVNVGAFFWLQNGSKQGFINALTSVLSPLRPFLTLLLAQGSITLFDAVTVYGSNGYNTAVIPILEALSCEAERIPSYADYKSTAATEKAITGILEPVTALLDRLIEKPVATVCEILPNLLYFTESGGLTQSINNLIYPVQVLLKKLDAQDLLPAELSGAGNIDLNSLIDDALSSSDLNLSLPEPDFKLIMSLGAAEERVSKRSDNGSFVNYTYIRSNPTEVLVSVLRYVVGALESEENSELLSGLLSQEGSEEGDMFAMYTGKITEQLKSMTTDETIEWLYDLLFAETPKRETQETGNETIPTVIYQETPDHTQRNVVLIVLLAALLIFGTIIFIAKFDFAEHRERRQRKKLRKQLGKDDIQKAHERGKVKAQADLKKVAETPSAVKASAPEGKEKSAVTSEKEPKAPETKAQRKERLKAEKAYVKNKMKEERDRQKAYNETKKADKYYERNLRKH